MGNSFGIALNPAWTEWAAKQGVSETIAAALYLLSIAKVRPSVRRLAERLAS
jgi:hypothetical protein